MVQGDLTILQDPSSALRKIWVMLEIARVAYIAYGGTMGGGRSRYVKPIATGRAMLQKRRAKYPLFWDQQGVVVDDSQGIKDDVDAIISSVFSTFQQDSGRGRDIPILLRSLSSVRPSDPPEPVPAPDLSASLKSIVAEATWIF